MAYASVTLGGSNPRSNESTSPDLVHGSSPATPEMAEVLGFASPATKRAAESTRGELGLARIQGGMRQQRRRLELAENELEAAPAFGCFWLRGCCGRGIAFVAPTAATRGSEHVGHDARTKWSPELCRRRVQTGVQSGERGVAATECKREKREGG